MYHVDITNKGDSLFQVKSPDYEFTIDTSGQGITPPDTLLAALGSCLGVYLRKYCAGAKISLPQFTISLDADFTKEGPPRFQEIRVKIDLQGATLDERRKEALVHFLHNCPVHNTLKANPSVEIKIV